MAWFRVKVSQIQELELDIEADTKKEAMEAAEHGGTIVKRETVDREAIGAWEMMFTD